MKFNEVCKVYSIYTGVKLVVVSLYHLKVKRMRRKPGLMCQQKNRGRIQQNYSHVNVCPHTHI